MTDATTPVAHRAGPGVALAARTCFFDERGDNTYLVGGGVSWRLDRHKDKVIQTNMENDEPEVASEKKSFLNTITFGLFAGNKRRNTTKMPEVRSYDVKPRDLEPPVNKKAQKARKKENKRLIKEQKRKEKAEKKYSKKSEKD